LGVKKPPRGFWAKVASGTQFKRPRLGALPEGCVLKTVIHGKNEASEETNALFWNAARL
jgi:hypothetical protein